MSNPDLTLTIDGTPYVIDPDDFELWEAEFMEDYCQAPFGAIDFGAFRTIRAMTWILLHRADPAVTMEDVGKLKMSKLEVGTTDDEEGEDEKPVPPTKPAAARPKRKPARKPVPGGSP